MPAEYDDHLVTLTAEILRDEVRVYDQGDIERWIGISSMLAGWNASMIGGDARTTGAMLTATGGFPVVTGAMIAAMESSSGAGSLLRAEPDVMFKRVFHLPNRLPGLRLPGGPELAHIARSSRMVTRLEALVRWLGQDGREVTATDDLPMMHAARAADSVGVQYHYFPYLWEYALVAGWIELCAR